MPLALLYNKQYNHPCPLRDSKSQSQQAEPLRPRDNRKPAASRYTDWAILAHQNSLSETKDKREFASSRHFKMRLSVDIADILEELRLWKWLVIVLPATEWCHRVYKKTITENIPKAEIELEINYSFGMAENKQQLYNIVEKLNLRKTE